MEKIKFSFIVPIYNTKKEYLDECIDSLVAQQYENYEIILVDDGSNQEIKDYLTNFETLPKTKLIHQENKGIVGARLTGLKHATGDYIYFVDSDDLVNKDLLNILVDIIDKYNPDMILHESPRFTDSIENITYQSRFMKEGMVDKQEVMKHLVSLHINPLTDKCTKREYYKGIENSIDSSIINGEDLQQSTYLILQADSFYYTEKNLDYYRHTENDKNYYDVTKLHGANYLIPAYKMIFENSNEYSYLLPYFKNAACKSIISIALQICSVTNKYEEKKNLLNELNKQEIIKILTNINVRIPFSTYLLFRLLTSNYNTLFVLLTNIYNLLTHQ